LVGIQLALVIYAFIHINGMQFREFIVLNVILNTVTAFIDTLGEALAMKILTLQNELDELEKENFAARATSYNGDNQE
jgi:hypothetical protein